MKHGDVPNFSYTIYEDVPYQLLSGVSWDSNAGIWEAEALNLDDLHDDTVYLCQWSRDEATEDEPIADRKDFTYCSKVIKSNKTLKDIKEDTDMLDKENEKKNQNPEIFTGNPQWGTEIPPEYDLTEPVAIK